MTVTMEQAHAAKSKLREVVKGTPGINGIGVAHIDTGWVIRVNLSAADAVDSLPVEFEGVPVQAAVIGPIRAYGSLSGG